jgi:dTDP-4-dehydrorhamnose reductase
MNKSILITGSTGMVGRNATESLNEAGYNVLAPTRMELDLIQPDQVKKYFESHKIDVVLHAISRGLIHFFIKMLRLL